MKYMWRCNWVAFVLTTISSLAMFGILYRLGRWDMGLIIATAPFVFGYAWFRLGQNALLRAINEARRQRHD